MTKTNEIFKAYVTNLHAYNCGYLRGEWVSFPAEPDELDAVLERIGCADGTEYFITDYDCEKITWYDHLGEYVSVEHLNELSEAIAALDEWQQDTLAAALELGNYRSISETIENLDDFNLYSDVNNDYDLGYMYAVECDQLDPDSFLAHYFDYEAYGRDIRLNEGGIFTYYGYIFGC